MKLNTTTNTIERIGNVTHEAQFRMRTSQKAFQILSDLYSDKPLAIVRELGCNAMDSMVASGKADQPFHIHLPNALEPWLTIQDFGTGISHNDIYEIYTVYFASTKTNSNSQIGCLGLGSKSPFCYSDNFSVTSIVDGEKRIYNAYFNEEGTPAIALMSMEKTTEANGVAIQIPIKSTDFTDFANAVRKSFRFFDVKPTISGGKVEWNNDTPLFQADDWAFYEKMADRYHGESYAIMGGVTYPIDLYQIKDDEGEYRQMLNNGLVLKFAMGELDFTPARDSLSYTPLTIKAIHDKLAKVKSELPIKVTEMIDKKDTLLEAIRASIFFLDKFYFLKVNQVGGSTSNVITWKGIDITQPLGFFKKLAPNLQVFKKYSYHRRKVSISVQPDLATDTMWFYDDLPKGGERRVRAYLTSDKNIMLFNKQDYDNLLKNNFSEDMFQKTSSLPSPTVQRKVRNGTVVQKAKEDITIYRMGEMYKESWKSEVIEPSDTLPKCYIVKPTDGWSPKVKLQGIRNLSTKSDINMVLNSFANLSSNDICMVSQREEKKLIKRGGCMKLEDWWKANINLDNINVEEVKTIAESVSYYLSDMIKSKNFKSLSDSNVIKQNILRFADMKKRNQDYVNSITYLESYDKIKMIDFGLTPAQKIVFDFLTNNHYDTEKYFTLAEALG